ncbi:hypothetical protein I3F58_25460 [Streptomyces sp. MUM 203J]|uniref:hypothetical protein n=1 Tax=Streptomyces sp. MUM 203J TaxID=2791990 RepID=UPI001F0333C4|nr:hypothetical protein [Streptomyces sp. MUM 203J]MCH0542847.1 hypothetical protein [Streptomyces sp. MUM 203J]
MSDYKGPDPAAFGNNPADFGADEIRAVPNGDGYHWTAYSKDGGQTSWNTDLEGNYRDDSPDPYYGPIVPLSDRNAKGSGKRQVWS